MSRLLEILQYGINVLKGLVDLGSLLCSYNNTSTGLSIQCAWHTLTHLLVQPSLIQRLVVQYEVLPSGRSNQGTALVHNYSNVIIICNSLVQFFHSNLDGYWWLYHACSTCVVCICVHACVCARASLYTCKTVDAVPPIPPAWWGTLRHNYQPYSESWTLWIWPAWIS